MPMTLAEKILARASGRTSVEPEEIVVAEVVPHATLAG